MMEENEVETTVFDRDSLIKTLSKSSDQSKCRKLVTTFALCGAFFSVGLAIAIPGPTLEFLRCSVQTNLERISYIFPSRSVGYLFGSIVSGLIFDKYAHRDKALLAVALFFASIGIACAPWASSLPLLCVLLFVGSIAVGFLDTGGNVSCLRLWGKQSGPYMQALHFSFGLGAFLAPLVAVPFLGSESCNGTLSHVTHTTLPTTAINLNYLPHEMNKRSVNGSEQENSTSNATTAWIISTASLESTTSALYTTRSMTESTNMPSTTTMLTVTTLTNFSTASLSPSNSTVNDTGLSRLFSAYKVHFSYLVIGMVMLAFSMLFYGLDSTGCCSKTRSQSQNDHVELSPNSKRSRPFLFLVKLMIAVFVFFFLYVGSEVAYGQLIATYGKYHNHLTEKQSALLTSVFWGAFTLARGLSIFLSRCLSPGKMIVSSVVISLIAAIGLMAVSFSDSQTTLLFGLSGLLGVGMAAVFPTGVLWLENHITISARMATIFVVASALGEMAIPTIVGLLIDRSGTQVLMVATLICITGCTLTFAIMYYLTNKNQASYSHLSQEEMVAMQSLDYSSSDESDYWPIVEQRMRASRTK